MPAFQFRDELTQARMHNGKKADPKVIGEELARITAKHNGKLDPHHVVGEARARTNPLHPFFEWTDKIAAEQYRLDQARGLIRSVMIIDDAPDSRAVRAYYNLRSDGRAYRPIQQILSSAQLQLEMLRQAESELANWERRWKEMADLCSEVRAARDKLRLRISALETHDHESRPSN